MSAIQITYRTCKPYTNVVYLQEQQPVAAAAQAPAAPPGEKKKSNIVTNWGQAAERKISLAAGHGSKPNAAAGEHLLGPAMCAKPISLVSGQQHR